MDRTITPRISALGPVRPDRRGVLRYARQLPSCSSGGKTEGFPWQWLRYVAPGGRRGGPPYVGHRGRSSSSSSSSSSFAPLHYPSLPFTPLHSPSLQSFQSRALLPFRSSFSCLPYPLTSSHLSLSLSPPPPPPALLIRTMQRSFLLPGRISWFGPLDHGHPVAGPLRMLEMKAMRVHPLRRALRVTPSRLGLTWSLRSSNSYLRSWHPDPNIQTASGALA